MSTNNTTNNNNTIYVTREELRKLSTEELLEARKSGQVVIVDSKSTTKVDQEVSGLGIGSLLKAATRFTKVSVHSVADSAKPIVRLATTTSTNVLNKLADIEEENRPMLKETIEVLSTIAGAKINEFSKEVVEPAMVTWRKKLEELHNEAIIMSFPKSK